ncbi:hypothetical protein CKF54_07575 [Psittacicella hinzii]|uniref:Uncharacterized protein n=1 Tax=Psittacicella hinzii TaxID=2028575 RepID=A0A3A1Y0J6_9GAMM|nr:hypothetical protein [Psittacicella hinzii]RIY31115.1 hypothetical protein CKF54_07575 [Psittacicella hinzii]
MNLKKALLIALISSTALISLKATADDTNLDHTYDNGYYINQREEDKISALEVKNITINDQSLTASHVTYRDGMEKLILGNVNTANKYYTIDRLIIQAPESMSVADINASLKVLDFKEQLSN